MNSKIAQNITVCLTNPGGQLNNYCICYKIFVFLFYINRLVHFMLIHVRIKSELLVRSLRHNTFNFLKIHFIKQYSS